MPRMDSGGGKGPGTLVDGEISADLGEIEGRPLEGQRHVDLAVALVDGKADIDAGRDRGADARHAAIGLSCVARKIALGIGP